MSLQDLLYYINHWVFKICFEDNPHRVGWEFHPIPKQKFKIKHNPEFDDRYYLVDCYTNLFTEKEMNLLYSYADGLSQKYFYNIIEGRCSLQNKLDDKMGDIEKQLIADIKIVKQAVKKRREFLNKNKVYVETSS